MERDEDCATLLNSGLPQLLLLFDWLLCVSPPDLSLFKAVTDPCSIIVRGSCLCCCCEGCSCWSNC